MMNDEGKTKKQEGSSFIIHHSSFIIHHSSFIIHRSSLLFCRPSIHRHDRRLETSGVFLGYNRRWLGKSLARRMIHGEFTMARHGPAGCLLAGLRGRSRAARREPEVSAR
jgi:hypothetical protein